MHCDECVQLHRAQAQRRRRAAHCPYCVHCQEKSARVLALEEVARELERQEWRAAAGAVRDMARNPPAAPRGDA